MDERSAAPFLVKVITSSGFNSTADTKAPFWELFFDRVANLVLKEICLASLFGSATDV